MGQAALGADGVRWERLLWAWPSSHGRRAGRVLTRDRLWTALGGTHMRKIVTFFASATVTGAALLRRGLAGYGRSEIGTLEHVGRVSGVRRLTPVHPEPTPAGFRIIVPLGVRSEWARNVVAAGHCRLLLHDQVFDLDEPAMVDAGQAQDLPWPLRRVLAAL